MYGHVITKFSGIGRFTYPWCSAGALGAPELRYKASVKHISSKGVLPLSLLAIAASILIVFWTVLFYYVYSSAENKRASLPARTILLAFVWRYKVQKWSVG